MGDLDPRVCCVMPHPHCFFQLLDAVEHLLFDNLAWGGGAGLLKSQRGSGLVWQLLKLSTVHSVVILHLANQGTGHCRGGKHGLGLVFWTWSPAGMLCTHQNSRKRGSMKGF